MKNGSPWTTTDGRVLTLCGVMGIAAGLASAGLLVVHLFALGRVDGVVVGAAALGILAAAFGAFGLVGALRSFARKRLLIEAVRALPDGVALWDENDILVASNDAFYEHTSPLSARIGEGFEDSLRRIAAARDFPDVSVDSPEGYIQARLDSHRNPGAPFERRHKSGRWIRVAEKRLAEGGIVTLYSDISPQKSAQQAIARQEALLQRIMDMLPAAISVKDRDLRLGMWNAYAAKIFGRAAEAMRGKRLAAEIPGPNAEAMEAADRLAIESNERGAATEMTVKIDGARRELWISKLPLRDDAGAVEGVVSIGWDVTDMRRMEAEAARDRRLLRDLVDALPMWVSIKDLDLRYALMNKAQARAFGVDEARVIGRRAEDLVVRGVAVARARVQNETNARRDREALVGGAPILFVEENYELSDGTKGTFATSRIPLRDEQGNVTRLLTLVFDITDLRRTEAELRESRELLMQSERIGRTGYMVSDFQKGRVEWSDSLFELRGVPKRPWFTSDESRSFYHSDDIEELVRRRTEAISARKPFEDEVRFRRPDGAYRWERMVGHPRYDAAGNPVGALIFVQDITEQKAVADALIAANRAKSQFLAHMSHELRTPLNAVIGYSEMMVGQLLGPLAPKYLEYAGDILRSGRHLLDVISDILDMARIEAGQHKLDIVDVDLADLADGCVRIVKVRAEGRRQTLSVDIPAEFPIFRADERSIRQVLINLLTNAIKFTPEGGRVDLQARFDETQVVVTVADTGPGIEPEHLERLFTPFARVEEANKKSVEGTGLGLAISRTLVELHGGTLTLESEWGHGTIATMTLPIVESDNKIKQIDLFQPPLNGSP